MSESTLNRKMEAIKEYFQKICYTPTHYSELHEPEICSDCIYGADECVIQDSNKENYCPCKDCLLKTICGEECIDRALKSIDIFLDMPKKASSENIKNE